MSGLWFICIVLAVATIISFIAFLLSCKKDTFVDIICLVVFVVSACFTISMFFITPYTHIEARKEVVEFEETRKLVEETGNQYNEYFSTEITIFVLNENKWLAKAKADKKQKGWFSKYYYIDLENVKPIKFRR